MGMKGRGSYMNRECKVSTKLESCAAFPRRSLECLLRISHTSRILEISVSLRPVLLVTRYLDRV